MDKGLIDRLVEQANEMTGNKMRPGFGPPSTPDIFGAFASLIAEECVKTVEPLLVDIAESATGYASVTDALGGKELTAACAIFSETARAAVIAAIREKFRSD